MTEATAHWQHIQCDEHGGVEAIEGAVINEMKWRLYVNRRHLVSFMCTPTDLHELALGFLQGEDLIGGLADIISLKVYEDEHRVYWYMPELGMNGVLTMQVCEESVGAIDVRLTHPLPDDLPPETLTSGCGGGVTFRDLEQAGQPLASSLAATPAQLMDLVRHLNDSAILYREVRGVHTSALADPMRLLVVKEDVGRHNTLDKIRGAALLTGLPTRDRILVTTGRVSSEMMTKAVRMGTPIVVSRTSPTALSVRLADAWGITLVGYARGRRLSVYTHPQRLGVTIPPPVPNG
ncbi:MAG: formate dehydrogenase accessory sulfurtransferase FdhD [Anaerolineae bacterium]|nr:formate dehydrogenase accessory sulfurtransferase FdhD [Anaerolineae bacterium]